jgi:hypothetical protein
MIIKRKRGWKRNSLIKDTFSSLIFDKSNADKGDKK